MVTEKPTGSERQVSAIGGASLDGAPVSYIVVLATVCTALAFVPFSVILALGSSFPLSQAFFPVVGWILGPLAGSVASGAGALIGVFVAPHTAGVPAVRVIGAVVASFVAGSMRHGVSRHWWWVPITGVGIVCLLLFGGRAAVQNGIDVWVVIAGMFINWSAVLLFALPTRTLIAKWIGSSKVQRLALGLGLGTWTAAGMAHLVQGTITYFMFNWPEEVWLTLIPIIPFEHLLRSAVGIIIGTGVIASLRATNLVKPRKATY